MHKKDKCTNCITSDVSIFKFLKQKEREKLEKNHICTHYKKGEIIYKEGDMPSGLVCLCEGKVKSYNLVTAESPSLSCV